MDSLGAQGTPSVFKAEWDGITVEYSQMPPGEFDASIAKNVVGVAFAPQERVTWRVDGSSSRTTPLPPGSVFLYSSREFVWSRWEQPTECLHMALAPELLSRVAADCSLRAPIELDYRVMFTDPTILHVGHLLKAEIHSGGLAGKLYTESLANILAVHLLREYSGLVIKSDLEDGPLGDLKLNHVKDFIEDQLAQELTIASMTAEVYMSPFHFARAHHCCHRSTTTSLRHPATDGAGKAPTICYPASRC